MESRGRKILVCDCNRTMPLDGKALARACAAVGMTGEAAVNTLLCRAQTGAFRAALGQGGKLMVACTQEAPLFAELRDEAGPQVDVGFTNIRERAGWSDEGERAIPKIAALLAEAGLDIPGTPSVSLASAGATLVYGKDEVAVAAAEQLAGRQSAAVLLAEPTASTPRRVNDMPVFCGRIVAAKGHLGAFELVVDGHAALVPSARGALEFEPPRDGVTTQCDVILDLSGGVPLFAAHEKRDGYLRPDPRDPVAVQRAIFDATGLVGEFEKPRYVRFDESLCVHSRSQKTGCTRCLDVCPTGAITPNGDHVAIDPWVCAGCGSCASVCPTGASTYDLPPQSTVFERLRTLLGAFFQAGGSRPVLFIHDRTHGEDMIAMIARHGRGLPARVLPFAVNEVTQVGFEFLVVGLAYGAATIRVLVNPRKRGETAGLGAQIDLAEATAAGLGFGAGRVAAIDSGDPEAVESALYALPAVEPAPAGSFLPMGSKREIALLALRHLRDQAPSPVEVLPLAAGAPFGAVEVDVGGCTLCLACVGACPTGALIDNPEAPMLRFVEQACVQCGLCKATCPEKVISLRPRLNFTEAVRNPALVKEEPPALCVRCGKPFGAKGSIDRVLAQLAGKHSMFKDPAAIERIKMCADCRVIVQWEEKQGREPFASKPPPVTRTTEDELRERDADSTAKKQ